MRFAIARVDGVALRFARHSCDRQQTLKFVPVQVTCALLPLPGHAVKLTVRAPPATIACEQDWIVLDSVQLTSWIGHEAVEGQSKS